MNIPVYTNSADVFENIKKASAACCSSVFFSHIPYSEEFCDDFEISAPFFSIIDASEDALDFKALLDNTAAALLRNDNIIVLILNTEEYKKREEYLKKYQCIIEVVDRDNIQERLTGILLLFIDNTHVLLNWRTQALTSNMVHGHFMLRGVYRAVPFVCIAIIRLMKRLDFIEDADETPINIALLELLTNAVEHGSFGISYKDKNRWLENHPDVFSLIEKTHGSAELQRKTIILGIQVFSTHAHFAISDEGAGFKWREITEQSHDDKNPKKHGFGIRMAKEYTKDLTYNEKGNSVSFSVPLNKARFAKNTPNYFVNNSHIALQKNEILISERADQSLYDSDNDIYLIVTGKLGVFKNKKRVGELLSNDMFCGEINYLLQKNRIATVIAEVETEVVPISPNVFSKLLKQYPNYGLLLARVAATRLDVANVQQTKE